MLFTWWTLPVWPFPKTFSQPQEMPGSSRHAQGNGSSSGSSTGGFGEHPPHISDLTATAQGWWRLLVPLWQSSPKDSSETFSSLHFLQSALLWKQKGEQNYIKQWLQKLCGLKWVYFFIILFQFLFNKQRVGGFLPVCLLLRSTITGKTSTFLMGYFSSVFFLQYFV